MNTHPKRCIPIRPQSEKLTCLRLQHPVALIHARLKRCDEFYAHIDALPRQNFRIKVICLVCPHRIARKENHSI